MWRNVWEIENIVEDASRSSDKRIVAYALVLARWVNIVNENSDGWPYWKAGAKAGEKLSDLMARVTGRVYGTQPGRDGRSEYVYGDQSYVPTDKELAATLTPMKTLATKRGLPSPLAVLEALAEKGA